MVPPWRCSFQKGETSEGVAPADLEICNRVSVYNEKKMSELQLLISLIT